MKRESWLVISYFANIDAMAPSHHIDDRLPFFEKEDIDVRLLSSPCGLRNRDISHVRVPSPAPSGIRYEVRYLLRRKTKSRFWFKFWETLLLLPVLPFYFLEKLLFRLDSTWSWFITASFAAVVMTLRKRPAIIYSTGGPVSAHLAAMAASGVTGVPYIAEFQDPLVHQYAAPGKFERHIIKHIERLIFQTAFRVVFLTKKAAENASARYKSDKSSAILAGGVPPEKVSSYIKVEQLRVAHFGSLGGSRDLRHFLRALELFFLDHPTLPGELRLDLYGNNSKAVRRQIEGFSYRDTLRVHGKVGRLEAVGSMYEADVLLLIQNTDDVSFETIPSKVYEYLHTGRPILALVYRNGELRTMLQSMGHLVVEADDPASIRAALETYVTRWKTDGLPGSNRPSPYTVEHAVRELLTEASRAPGEKQS